jgi:hypothetical protein
VLTLELHVIRILQIREISTDSHMLECAVSDADSHAPSALHDPDCATQGPHTTSLKSSTSCSEFSLRLRST